MPFGIDIRPRQDKREAGAKGEREGEVEKVKEKIGECTKGAADGHLFEVALEVN